jgi:hypothetical protein
MLVLFCLVVSGAIVGITLWPTWIWNTRGARRATALLAFIAVALLVSFAGAHGCNEGGTPLFLVLGAALGCAAAPLLETRRLWVAPVLVATLCFTGMFTAVRLTDLYHRRAYTGNPAHASGWFWHTPFTGLYPRSAEWQREDKEVEPPPR